MSHLLHLPGPHRILKVLKSLTFTASRVANETPGRAARFHTGVTSTPTTYRLPNGDFSNSSIARARCAYAATISFAGKGSTDSNDRINAVSSSNCDCHRLGSCFTTSPHMSFTVLTPIAYGNPHPRNTPPPATTTTEHHRPGPSSWACSTPPATGGGTATTQCPFASRHRRGSLPTPLVSTTKQKERETSQHQEPRESLARHRPKISGGCTPQGHVHRVLFCVHELNKYAPTEQRPRLLLHGAWQRFLIFSHNVIGHKQISFAFHPLLARTGHTSQLRILRKEQLSPALRLRLKILIGHSSR